MFLARIVFFRLHESPRYLVHAGRPQDAIKSLQLISRFNGSDISIELEDVRDHHHDAAVTDFSKFDAQSLQVNSVTAFAANVVSDGPTSITGDPSTESVETSRSILITHYAATGETPDLDSRNNSTAPEQNISSDSPTEPMLKYVTGARQRRESFTSRRSCIYEQKIRRVLPNWLRRPLWAWWDRVMMVLAPEWRKTTILVWSAWCGMSLGPLISMAFIHHFAQILTIFFFLAYTMFNVFLPKLLETRSTSDVPQTLEQSLWDVVIFTVGGCPGALVCFLFCFVLFSPVYVFNLHFAYIDWRLPNRVEDGSKMVISWKHVHYSFFLCDIHSRRVEVGGYVEYRGDKFECDGESEYLLDAQKILVC